mgnify:CR=1 FL=1
METYGKVDVTSIKGTIQRDIVNYITSKGNDGRKIDIVQCDDDSIMINIENEEGTGRNPKQQLNLTKESVCAIAGLLTLFLYKLDYDTSRIFTREDVKTQTSLNI